MKKTISICMLLILSLTLFTGCGGGNGGGFDASKAINVVSREEGSGTRGAFIELFGVEEKIDGKKVDKTATTAAITNNTSVMMTTVSGDAHAIGYISLGSINNTVKALPIDGVTASVENIKNGSYKISRPFLIATKGDQSDATKDFISFILSKEGQEVVKKNGYIPNETTDTFKTTGISGKITIAGSSSVTPVMEKLAEEYKKLNAQINIEIQQSDSSAGMTSAIGGICDIGMSSRALTDTEKEKGLKDQTIATDGIAVIVNTACGVTNLTKEQVKNIFTGNAKAWSEVSK